MSKLENLLETLCPDGVEYLELGKICRFQNGFAFKSSLFRSSGLPILRITNIKDSKLSEEGYVFFELKDYKENLESYKVNKGDVVVAMSGATTGKVGYNYTNNIYYLNQRVGMFVPNEEKLNKRYLFHWLCSKSNEILNISSGSGAQPNLSSIKMMQFKIPVPPIEVQKEIVKILDNFTMLSEKLSEKLSAELTARKKQYEFYRDKLLTFDKTNVANIEWKKIDDLIDYVQPSKYIVDSTEYDDSYTTPVLTAGQSFILGYTDETDGIYNASKEKPVIIFDDFTAGFHWVDFNFKVKSSAMKILVPKDGIVFRFFYYLMGKINYTSSAHTRLWIGTYSQFSIPIPPLDVQERIVRVLDNFDAICSDLKIGLPSEIEKRQQQYEYYRDKLLTFKEKV